MLTIALLALTTHSCNGSCIFHCGNNVCGDGSPVPIGPESLQLLGVDAVGTVRTLQGDARVADLSGRGIDAIADGGFDCFFTDPANPITVSLGHCPPPCGVCSGAVHSVVICTSPFVLPINAF